MEKIYTKDGIIHLLNNGYSARETDNALIIEGVKYRKNGNLAKIGVRVDYIESQAAGFGSPVHPFKTQEHKKALLMKLSEISKTVPTSLGKKVFSGLR